MATPRDIVYKPGFHKYTLWGGTELRTATQYVLRGEEGSVVFSPTTYRVITYHVPSTTSELGNENCCYLGGRDCNWGEVPEPDNAAELDEADIEALMMEVYKDNVMGYWERQRWTAEVEVALS